MVPETTMFTMALGKHEHWWVTDVLFDAKLKEFLFHVYLRPWSRFTCPSSGASDQPIRDTHPRN